MLTAASPKEKFFELFDRFDRKGPTERFHGLREEARRAFEELDFPGPKTEDWRFTSLRDLLALELRLAEPVDLDPKRLPPPTHPAGPRLVFVNGFFARDLSSGFDRPGTGYVGNLAAAPAGMQHFFDEFLTQGADHRDHLFTALNGSFLADGALIRVEDGQAIDSPIEILHWTVGDQSATWTTPRLLAIAGRAARFTVIERFLASDGDAGHYCTCPVAEWFLGEKAVVDHVKVQQDATGGYHLANSQALLAARAQFSSRYFGLGGKLVRNESRVRFDGEHAEATLDGLYIGNDRRHLDNHTVIDHAVPNCNSHELYKGILDGHSHGVFNGKIFVRQDAQKTDAKQTNRVLLLSDDAIIDTKPQLEIFADDVKCTHGASVGQLDPDQLYYLRSRGIDRNQARRILTFAFANDVVERIRVPGLREELENILLHADWK